MSDRISLTVPPRVLFRRRAAAPLALFALFLALSLAPPPAARADVPAEGQTLTQPSEAKALAREAAEAASEGDPERALQLYTYAIEADPLDPEPRLMRAILRLNLGETEAGLEELEAALETCGPDAQLYLFSGIAFINLGRGEDAVVAIRRALETGGLTPAQSAQALNLLGVAEVSLLHWDEARRAFQDALARNPQLADAQANLAVYYRYRRQPDMVLRMYGRALELDANHLRALMGRAGQLTILQRYDEARADLDRARRVAEEQGALSPELFWRSALVEWRLGRNEAARKFSAAALELDPENPEGAVLAGFIEAQTSREAPTPAREINQRLREAAAAEKDDRPASAVLFYTDADLRAPGDDRAPHGRGRAYAALGALSRAKADLERAILAHDRNADAHYLKGNVELDLARPYAAIVDFRRALALRGRFCEPWLGLGNALLQIRRYAEAVIAFDNYLQCGAPTALLFNNRGVANWNLNLPEQALADFTRAIELDPNYALAWFNRGVLRAQMGDLDGGCEDLATARRLDPEDPDIPAALERLNCQPATAPPPLPAQSPEPPPTAPPSLTQTPRPAASQTAAPTAPVSPSPSLTASPSPSASPTPLPSATPSLTPRPTPPPQATPAPTLTPPPLPTLAPAPPPEVKVTPAPSPSPMQVVIRTPAPAPPPAPEPAAVKELALTIRTEPAGGFVAINGMYAGVAPLTRLVPQGKECRITILGEKRLAQEMTYQAPRNQAAATLTVSLAPRATFQTLKFESRRLQNRLGSDPDNPLLLVQLGEVALANNSFERGAQLAARALQLAPDFAYAEKALGIYEANLANAQRINAKTEEEKAAAAAKLASARAHLERALRAAPGSPWAIVAAATPDVLEGRFDDAEKRFRQALKADPRYVPALNSLAGLELRRAFAESDPAKGEARLQAARELLQSALEIEPDSTDALSRLALLEGVAGNNDKSLALCDQAIALDPDDPQPFIVRANARLTAGRVEDAREDLIRALTLHPNDEDTRAMFDSLNQ